MKPFFYTYRVFQKLQWILIGSALFAVLFHFFGLSQTFLFNEDIWVRTKFTLNNFWRSGEGVHFSPLHNLIRALTNDFLPLWGTFSHLQMMISYLVFVILCFCFFKKKLQLEPWLVWLGIGILTTIPFITEGTFWIFGSHTFYSTIVFLAALVFFPDNDKEMQWQSWLVPGTMLLLMLSASPVTYASYFLLIIYLTVRFYKQTKILAVIGGLFLLGMLYIYIRNLFINGDGWTFTYQASVSYGMNQQFSFVTSLESLVEILEYSNPLIVLQRHLFDGYLSQSSRSFFSLFHLFWVLPLWGIILFRRSSKGWEVFIYGVGAAAALMMVAPPLATRLLIPLMLVQTTGFLLLLHYWIHPLQIIKKILILLIGLCVIGSNLTAKIEAEWYHWILPKRIEQTILDIAVQTKDQEVPLVLLTHTAWKKQSIDHPSYASGSSATLGGLRKILGFAGIHRCIYQGYREDANPQEIEMVHNENDIVFFYVYQTIYTCPAILQEAQPVLCYQYNESLSVFGEFQQIRGNVTVPGSTKVNPADWNIHDQTYSIQVHCI
ncbi:MAG: hypothetical protein HQM14_15400 [SAR324 cluster bacterium]|nr:hypothetical protein [SAR324 cluster bacterium]